MSNIITKSIIVKGDVPEIYEIWADFGNFPKFISQIKSVTPTGSLTSRWEMESEVGELLEWNTKITRLEENQRIAWKTTEGDIKFSGQVTFTGLPNSQTEVTATFQFASPQDLPTVREASSKSPNEVLEDSLHNFKAFVEKMPDRMIS